MSSSIPPTCLEGKLATSTCNHVREITKILNLTSSGQLKPDLEGKVRPHVPLSFERAEVKSVIATLIIILQIIQSLKAFADFAGDMKEFCYFVKI